MSLLAGFDLMSEISNPTILKMIKANLKIQGSPVSPPFQIQMPISTGGVNGNVAIIIEDVTLDLNADTSLTLTMPFDKTSVMIQSPINITMCPLAGNLTIKAPLHLVSSGNNKEAFSKYG